MKLLRAVVPPLVLVLAVFLSPCRPAAGETVTEDWRSPFGTPRSVSVNPADGSVWAATGNSVMHLGADGTILSQTDGFLEPLSVAANPTDGSCWVADFHHGEVVRLAASGAPQWRFGTTGLPNSVSVNSTDGSCWISGATWVLHLAANGAELWRGGGFDSWSVSANPTDGSCWVADSATHQVVHLAANGAELWRGGGFNDPQSVSVNSTDGSCWVADLGTFDNVSRYVNSGVTLLGADGSQLWRGGGFNSPYSVSANPTDGSCWVADTDDGQVVHLAANGAELWRGGHCCPSEVSVNPSNGSCWVADGGHDQVVHLSAAGAELWRGGRFSEPLSVSVNSTDGSCWVADTSRWYGSEYVDGAVVHLSAAGVELWRSGGFSWPCSVSVNSAPPGPDPGLGGSCWVADRANNQVVHLSAAGAELWRGGGFYQPWSVSVNPTDGSCWVADYSRVVHLSAGGTELWRGGEFYNPVDVSVNPTDGSCWVADGKWWNGSEYVDGAVVHLSAAGTQLWRGGGVKEPSEVSANPTDGSCWVAERGRNRVAHLAGSGAALWQAIGFKGPVSISANPRDGSCWVGDSSNGGNSPWVWADQMVHLAANGAELWRGGGFDRPYSVSVDATDGSCWVADHSNSQVVHLVITKADAEPVSPYPTEAEWASGVWHPHRGQLHAHYMPDGAYRMLGGVPVGPRFGPLLSPRTLLEIYGAARYDFVAVTEHQPDWKFDEYTWPKVFDEPGVPGVISLVGSAEDTGATHILGIGFGTDIVKETMGSSVLTELVRLRNITDNGGLAFVAHPDSADYWWSFDKLRGLAGAYQGLELYNTAVYYMTKLLTGWDWAALDQGYALDRWDNLLRSSAPNVRNAWGTAGDDYTPNIYQGWAWLDDACVVAWTPSPTPDEEQIKQALRAGRSYACKGGSRAPEILACWADPVSGSVSVQLPAPYAVTFVRGRPGLAPVTVAPAQQGDGTFLASYRYRPDDLYVRAEVRDRAGNTSWLQPIWVDRVQTRAGASPSPRRGASAAGAAEALLLDMDDAQLTVSMPQGGLTQVTGTLLNGEARPPAPPTGYLSLCYQFTPEVALEGTNSLTIDYLPDTVRAFPESSLAIYRYDSGAGSWLRLDTAVGVTAASVSTSITQLGIYAVSAEEPTDVAPPTVAITYPSPGAEIAVPTPVLADASDDQGVVSIRFYLDGWPFGADNWGGDGWAAILDPANYTSGVRTVTAVAEDGVGNQAMANLEIAVTGLMPTPVVTIASPAPGETVWGDLCASGTWSGQLSMALGVFSLDDQPLTATPPTDGPWQIGVPIPAEQAGDRTFKAVGFDIYGNRAEATVALVLKVFGDVPLDFWARNEIYAAARRGIVQGYSDGTYRPAVEVKRDQMAVYVARALCEGDAHVPSGPAEPTFTDVLADHWAYKYIEYCVANYIVVGYAVDNTYRPGEKVNRGQMAAYVARAIYSPRGIPPDDLPGYLPPLTPSFPDVPTDYAFYKHVEYVVGAGVVQGYGDGTYRSGTIVNRGQMAVYVQRAFQLPM